MIVPFEIEREECTFNDKSSSDTFPALLSRYVGRVCKVRSQGERRREARLKRSVFVSGEYNSIGISRVIEPYFLPMLVSSSTPVRFEIERRRRTAPTEVRHYSPLSLTDPYSITYLFLLLQSFRSLVRIYISERTTQPHK